MTPARAAIRNRSASALIVVGVLACFHALVPDEEAREEAEYVFVLTLGYGHLVGAVIARRPGRGLRPSGVSASSWKLFQGVGAATLFFAYSALLDLFPASEFLAFAGPLLAISVWHTLENDLAVARAYRSGFALGPVRRDDVVLTIGVSAVVLLGAEGLMRLGATFADVFTASTLYHLFQWLVFLQDRARRGSDPVRGAAMLRAIVWSHLPAGLLCGGIVLGREALPPVVGDLVFSPSLYLFWSSLHVLQTAVARARAVTRPAMPAVA